MNTETEIRPEPPEFEHHADVSAERLARVYAESLLAVAEEAGQTQQVLQDMDSFVDDVLVRHAQLGVLFGGAAVGRNARREALAKVFGDPPGSVFGKFMMVLNEHERLNLLRPIRQALHDLDDERNRRMKIHVYTAVPLPGEYAERIGNAVRQHFGMEPVLVPHVEPSLLGGMKIRIGDTQLDATVRTRLDNLRNQIIARSSYEIQSRRDHFSTN
jgi:F-type H+-transporting ATPase subunit delta